MISFQKLFEIRSTSFRIPESLLLLRWGKLCQKCTTRQANIEQKVQSASQKTPTKDNLVQGAASRVRQARTAWADLRDDSDNNDYDDYA